MRIDSFTAGLLLYGALLGLSTGGYFFAVVPPMLMYMAGSLNLRNERDRELTYEDILLFRTREDILDFLRGNIRTMEVREGVDFIRTGIVWAMAVFFTGLFAYAYGSVYPLLSLSTLPLLIRRKS